jgi:hypothetical protein
MKVDRLLFEQIIREELEAVLNEQWGSGWTGAGEYGAAMAAAMRQRSKEIKAMLKGELFDCKTIKREYEAMERGDNLWRSYKAADPNNESRMRRLYRECESQSHMGSLEVPIPCDDADKDGTCDSQRGLQGQLETEDFIKGLILSNKKKKKSVAQALDNMTDLQKHKEKMKVKSFLEEAGNALSDFADGPKANFTIRMITDEVYINSVAMPLYRLWQTRYAPEFVWTALGHKTGEQWTVWRKLKAQGFKMDSLWRVAKDSRFSAASAALKGTRAPGRVGRLGRGIFRQVVSGWVGFAIATVEISRVILELMGDIAQGDIDKRTMEHKEITKYMVDLVTAVTSQKESIKIVFTAGEHAYVDVDERGPSPEGPSEWEDAVERCARNKQRESRREWRKANKPAQMPLDYEKAWRACEDDLMEDALANPFERIDKAYRIFHDAYLGPTGEPGIMHLRKYFGSVEGGRDEELTDFMAKLMSDYMRFFEDLRIAFVNYWTDPKKGLKVLEQQIIEGGMTRKRLDRAQVQIQFIKNLHKYRKPSPLEKRFRRGTRVGHLRYIER